MPWKPARITAVLAVAFVLTLFIFFWHLGSSPANLSPAEAATRATSNITSIYHNPLNAPWRLAQAGLLQIKFNSHFLARLPSAIFGIMFMVLFYWLIKGWFGRPIGFLSTALLVTTPFFILLARNGTPKIMYLMPIAIIASCLYVEKSEGSKLAWLAFTICIAASLYIPGMIYLLLLGLLVRRLKLLDNTDEIDSILFFAGLCLLFLILATPLVWACVQDPKLVKQLMLIPSKFGTAVASLKDFAWMLLALGVKTRQHQNLTINRLPIFNIAQVGLAFIGSYVMWERLRTKFLWLVLIVLMVCAAASLNNSFYLLAIALPFIAILVGLGLRYLYVEWVHVFPLNPIPRYFAITLMGALVLMHIIYGVRFGLVAWPHSVAVQQLYVIK